MVNKKIFKRMAVFTIFIIVIVSIYIECCYSYLKISIVEDKYSESRSQDLDSYVILSDLGNEKIKFKKKIKLTGKQSDYGLYIIKIPVTNKKDEIDIRYVRYNNWLKSEIEVKKKVIVKDKKEYLKIRIFLRESGRFSREKNVVNRVIPLNQQKHSISLEL